MPNYRRNRIKGGCYFFTVNQYQGGRPLEILNKLTSVLNNNSHDRTTPVGLRFTQPNLQ